jgi:hypothetical protein
MALSPDRWTTVDRLYHAALARPLNERMPFLAEACAGDEELRQEVESLLAQDASANAAVLTGGAAFAAAGLVSDIGRSALTERRLSVYQISAGGRWVGYTVTKVNVGGTTGPGTGYVIGVASGAPRRVCDDCQVWQWTKDNSEILITEKAIRS